MRVILSGGGTGGHIFPALATAEALEKYNNIPKEDILFVGAEGRMEMERVPAAGYKIQALPIQGLQRGSLKKNVLFIPKLISSLRKASRILDDFKPNVVIGFGGYASGPLLWVAQRKGIPTVVQEQNSYAGLTNKWLAKGAKKIAVAWPEMQAFFPSEKIIVTGNPVRGGWEDLSTYREEAFRWANWAEDGRPVLLVCGGSLGARTLNQALLKHHKQWLQQGIRIIWQTGKAGEPMVKEALEGFSHPDLLVLPFLEKMAFAYALATVVVARAGALTLSELTMVGKPAILIPSPHVTADHQTFNAKALVNQQAALLLPDNKAVEELPQLVERLLFAPQAEALRTALGKQISQLAKPDAARQVASLAVQLAAKA